MRTTTVKIKRPEGNIETVDVSDKFPQGLSDPLFAAVKEGTYNAGKGECLSYLVEDEPLTEDQQADIDAYAKKCQWFAKHGFNANDIN